MPDAASTLDHGPTVAAFAASPFVGAIAAVLLGSLFAGAEAAVSALGAARLGAMLDEAKGVRRHALLRIQADADSLRSRYVFGRMSSATLATALLCVGFAGPYPNLAPWLAAGTMVVGAVPLYETATSLGRRYADAIAPMAVAWLRPIELVLLPLAVPLTVASRILTRHSPEPASSEQVAEREVEHMVDEVERSGLVGREPASIIRNVLDLRERVARDVMVRRDKIEGLEASTTLDDARRFVTESGHSRYPVFRDQLDNVVGLLVAKDLYRAESLSASSADQPQKPASLADILRPNPNFVAETMPLVRLFREMRARREHLAVVVDEYGSIAGIVTLEDVLEEIVGDIRDEHDEAPVVDLGQGRYLVDAQLTLSDVDAYLQTSLSADEPPAALGDLVLARLQPAGAAVGATVEAAGLRLVVRDFDGDRVRRVELERLPGPPAKRPPASQRPEPVSPTEAP